MTTGRGGGARAGAPGPVEISAAEARRIAVAAAGLGRPRPAATAGPARALREIERLGVVQIDAVNVLARAHEVPLFSRLGPYPPDLLATLVRRGALVEAWAHEASLIPAAHHPLLEWRRRRPHPWRALTAIARDRPALVEALLAEVADRGPLTAGELESTGRDAAWWGWGPAKQALEVLFWQGRVAVRRRPDFTREYGLPEQVLPPAARAPAPPDDEARRALVSVAVRALGVATVADLADHHRQSPRDVTPLIPGMVADGRLVPARVEGWTRPAYLDPALGRVRRAAGAALVSPFDPLVWGRERIERLFGFRYRLEIYTPAARRVHGYYVLPFLLGDRLVARVDLRAERAAGVLRVCAAYAEADAPRSTAEALAAELALAARWRGLHTVAVEDRGDLAPALRAVVRAAAVDVASST